MVAILTSSLGGSYKVNGKRIPTCLQNENGLLDQIKKYWKPMSKVLIISAGPNHFIRNDNILFCQREAFVMSGLDAKFFDICDARNEEMAQNISEYDVIILAGGHVPTQNKFFKKIRLKQNLENFQGMLIAWSAGSMNCAAVVYAQPELEGEAVSKEYKRFMEGLGITNKMIIPHYQDVKNDIVDGLRVMEDITYPDSMGKEFLALNDGSFLVSVDGEESVYGEAFIIKDGKQLRFT